MRKGDKVFIEGLVVIFIVVIAALTYVGFFMPRYKVKTVCTVDASIKNCFVDWLIFNLPVCFSKAHFINFDCK